MVDALPRCIKMLCDTIFLECRSPDPAWRPESGELYICMHDRAISLLKHVRYWVVVKISCSIDVAFLERSNSELSESERRQKSCSFLRLILGVSKTTAYWRAYWSVVSLESTSLPTPRLSKKSCMSRISCPCSTSSTQAGKKLRLNLLRCRSVASCRGKWSSACSWDTSHPRSRTTVQKRVNLYQYLSNSTKMVEFKLDTGYMQQLDGKVAIITG